jgi:uncharacterized protein (TIGR02996 family)
VENQRLALLQAIIDDPDDDARRLVYADWLEEHGDESDSARAEYIRLTVEKARLRRSDPRREQLLGRMRALLKQHRSRWFADSPLVRPSPWKARHRGFIRHARGNAFQFYEHAAALFAAEPVTCLYLEPGAVFDAFAASPYLARLREIKFPEGSLPPGGLAQVARRLSSLRKLELSYWRAGFVDLDVFVRAPWPHLQELRTLHCGLDDRALALLAGMNAPRLECLQLACEQFGPRGIEHLLGAPWLAQLTQLSLTLMGQPPTPDTLHALAHAPQLARLRFLNLSHNPLGPQGLKVLAESPHFGQVRRLDLSYTEGGAGGLMALFNSSTLSQVRNLSFGGNELDFTAIEEGQVTPWPSLRDVYISPLSDQGLSWLVDRSLLSSVRHLWAPSAGLTGTGFLALLRSALPHSLVSLVLSTNHLGSLDGLPSALEFPRLRLLELDHCYLGDQGAVRLLQALRAPSLRRLSLYQNELSNEAVGALTSNPTLCSLEEVSMSYHSGIDDEGARLFCESAYLDRLRVLQLFETSISDKALTRLRRRFRHVHFSPSRRH